MATKTLAQIEGELRERQTALADEQRRIKAVLKALAKPVKA